MSVVPLRVMVVIKNRGPFLACADECHAISHPFGIPSAPLDFPKNDLVKVPAIIGPLPMP
jgi:hypothetical protein